jgi:outer membrane protein
MFKAPCVLAFIFLSILTCRAQSAAPGQPDVELSLERAIQMASFSQQSTAVERGEQIVNLAKSGYGHARSSLLPDVDGAVTEQNQIVNLRALGLRFQPSPAFSFPDSVGPFSTFDARIRMTQNILNLSTIRSLQAAREQIHSAEAEKTSIRDYEAGHVAKLYAAALRAEAELQAGKSSITLAEALRDQALRKKSAGDGTDIEVARTRLAVARHQQRSLAAETEVERTKLELINLLNLGWDTRLKLTGKLAIVPADMPTVADAVATAIQSRADLKGQEERTASARLKNTAARLERLPSVIGYGDYGVLSGVQTYVVGATLRIPIFDGGRMEADRAQALSLVRQEEIREKELRKGVELEIRKVLATLASTRQQVEVAEQAVSFASDVLAHATRLYEAGATNSIDVVDAQTQVEIAKDQDVAALFDYTNARIDLAEAMGTTTQLKF